MTFKIQVKNKGNINETYNFLTGKLLDEGLEFGATEPMEMGKGYFGKPMLIRGVISEGEGLEELTFTIENKKKTTEINVEGDLPKKLEMYIKCAVLDYAQEFGYTIQ